ncbi:response regulator [Neptunicella marina]|uniref:Response regulator n=1 Tax=Neptunicella marina TaxID=2125989 RepID=A0A8J6IML7_9ALTE|nr:response regulator [Neptunicella marina]MBC3764266.1 response regulator [Neptunicella marina]
MDKMTYHDKRILVVDDHRPFLLKLRNYLNALGAQSINLAETAEEAVRLCENQLFDIVISDHDLGSNAQTGMQLLEELRYKKLLSPDTLYLMVSGNTEHPPVMGKLENQPDDYLIKPFSQAQLANRIGKIATKHKALRSLYRCLFNKDIRGAINACKDAISSGSRYRQFCSVVMVELLWREDKFDVAMSVLDPLVRDTQLPWAVMAMAKTMMYKRQFEEAINMARNIVDNRVLAADSHDILAQCYLRTEKLAEACEEIKQAINLSPHSIERQYLGCEIAQASGDYDFAKNCCLAILEQSRHSVHKNISHMCNYIRSILELAEQALDPKLSNKYHQDALLELQRQKQTELVQNSPQPFDFDAFETIVNARISVIQGKLQNARRALYESQQQIEQKFADYPSSLAPDSIKIMFDLGEYEQASALLDKVRDTDTQDPNTQRLLSNTIKQVKTTSGSFDRHKKKAIECYNQGQYQASYDAFHQALALAPMNTGVAINLLQVIGKLIAQKSKPDPQLKMECRKLYHSIDSLQLPDSHRQKLTHITPELQAYLG